MAMETKYCLALTLLITLRYCSMLPLSLQQAAKQCGYNLRFNKAVFEKSFDIVAV